MSNAKTLPNQIARLIKPETTSQHPLTLICKHCQSETVYIRNVPIEKDFFCCHGCETVYNFLKKTHLMRYYDHLELLSLKPTPLSEELENDNYVLSEEECFIGHEVYRFFVPKLHCAACLWLIENALSLNETVKSVSVNLMNYTIDVRMGSSSFNTVVQTLCQLG